MQTICSWETMQTVVFTLYAFISSIIQLEVITLLLLLKVRWPDRITLLRGNHETRQVNLSLYFIVLLILVVDSMMSVFANITTSLCGAPSTKCLICSRSLRQSKKKCLLFMEVSLPTSSRFIKSEILTAQAITVGYPFIINFSVL